MQQSSSTQTTCEAIDAQLADLKGCSDPQSQELRYSLLREKQALLMGWRQEVAEILGGFSSGCK